MNTLQQVGLVLHKQRPLALKLAHQTIAWCAEHQISVLLTKDDAALIAREDLGVIEDDFAARLDGCISIGGDGTMLRTVNLVSGRSIPILGVNAGGLGYLTALDAAQLEQALAAWLADEVDIDERMMLDVFVSTENGSKNMGHALNEVVVSCADSGGSLNVMASIGAKPFTNYIADGLIVATPTGSTAYSLSAGGPIVEPGFEAIILTPVAAHNLFAKSMVMAPTTEITMTVRGHRRGLLSVDGRTVLDIDVGESVTCSVSGLRAKLLSAFSKDFHAVLKEKFNLVDRRDQTVGGDDDS